MLVRIEKERKGNEMFIVLSTPCPICGCVDWRKQWHIVNDLIIYKCFKCGHEVSVDEKAVIYSG